MKITNNTKLIITKIIHTAVWALFAGAIIAAPVFTYWDDIRTAFALTGIVMIEVLILAVNKFKCPLTGIAERYTDAREDNFDIYLPLLLARYNKQIFGFLYAAGILYLLFSI